MKKTAVGILCILLILVLIPAAFAEGKWVCSSCKSENEWSKFCIYCGSKNPNAEPITLPADHTHELVSFGEPKAATCMESGMTAGIKCSVCGEVLEGQAILPKKEHEWRPATCIRPSTCTVCGSTQGTTAEHTWKTEGAYTFCAICGENKNSSGSGQGTYLNDMQWKKKNCKFYFYSSDTVTFANNLNWNDIDTRGYVASTRDIWDNVYQYGMHLDSGKEGPYWVEYDIGGKYTRFTGTLSCPYEPAGGTRPPSYWYKWNEYYKVITIYVDGRPKWTSPHMTETSEPVQIDLDITGARTFKVEYTGSDYSNEIAVLYDALFT